MNRRETTDGVEIYIEAECECGSLMKKEEEIILLTDPVQYRYFCTKCDNVESSFDNFPTTIYAFKD